MPTPVHILGNDLWLVGNAFQKKADADAGAPKHSCRRASDKMPKDPVRTPELKEHATNNQE